MQAKHIISVLVLTAIFGTANAQKHNLDVNVGGGLQGNSISMEEGCNSMRMGFNLGANYRYMFNANLGAGAGLGLASFRSVEEFDGVQLQMDAVDDENGQDYTRIIDFSSLQEKQRILAFEVPVALFYLKPLRGNLTFKGDVGAKLILPVWNEFNVSGGSAVVTGKFPSTGVTYEDLPQHGFTSYGGFAGDAKLKSMATAVFVDAGVQKEIKNIKAYLGAYFSYSLTSLTEATDCPLFDGVHYQGALSSGYAGNSHLVQAGIKLGVSLSFPRGGAAGNGGESEGTDDVNLVIGKAK